MPNELKGAGGADCDFWFKKKIKWFRPHVKPWSTKCSLERPAKEKNFTGVFRHHVAHLSIGDHSLTW